jgi:hypothetical protein
MCVCDCMRANFFYSIFSNTRGHFNVKFYGKQLCRTSLSREKSSKELKDPISSPLPRKYTMWSNRSFTLVKLEYLDKDNELSDAVFFQIATKDLFKRRRCVGLGTLFYS